VPTTLAFRKYLALILIASLSVANNPVTTLEERVTKAKLLVTAFPEEVSAEVFAISNKEEALPVVPVVPFNPAGVTLVPEANKGVNACEIDIVITRASSTTADFQLDFDWKVLEDYAAESTDYAIRPLNFMLEQTGASFIWGDTPLTITFQGKVSDAADELKLGFYMIESLQKS